MGDYSSYVGTADLAAAGGLLAVLGTFWLLGLAVGIFLIVCMWKIFKKAGQEGWKSIIPIYNTIVLFKIVGLNPWLVLIYLAGIIPIVGGIVALVLSVIVMVKLSKSFGKEGAYAVGLILLPVVFLPMLAFGSAQYVGNSLDTTEPVVEPVSEPVVEPISENPIDENK